MAECVICKHSRGLKRAHTDELGCLPCRTILAEYDSERIDGDMMIEAFDQVRRGRALLKFFGFKLGTDKEFPAAVHQCNLLLDDPSWTDSERADWAAVEESLRRGSEED